MKRLIFVALAFLAGCNGTGSAGRLFPSQLGATRAAGADAIANPQHRKVARVHITMTVPRRHPRGRVTEAHPSTISPFTQSVGIAVNGGAALVFNVTPSSPDCTSGNGGTTCTFTLNAPIGTDSFVVTTYNATGGGGTQLDYGTAMIPVVAGRANDASIRLGPVVSLATDSGPGSLRYAIGNANPGDTIMFVGLPAGTTIKLASPLTISISVTIAGPGVTSSPSRRGDALRGRGYYHSITLSGGGVKQILLISPGATVTVSGLILTDGKATIANQPGGAINNQGTLTASGDVFLTNTSTVDSPYVRRDHLKVPRPPAALTPAARQPHCAGADEYGGALYNHGTANVSGSTFDGNTVSTTFGCAYGYGGAVYNDEYGIFTSSGNTYVNNAAEFGGAVFNNAQFGQASFSGDAFDGNLGCTGATGCPVSGCTSTCTSYAFGEGAGIYDDLGNGITVTNSVFENNVVGGTFENSYGYGAAIYFETGSPSVVGSTFMDNIAGGGTAYCSIGEGGAVLVNSTGIAEFDDDTFTDNHAGGDKTGAGGAIFGSASFAGRGDTFTSNIASSSGSACADGSALGGAAVALYGATFSDSTFGGNVADASYDAYGGALTLYEYAPSHLISNTFTSNKAIATGAMGVPPMASGGAIENFTVLTMNANAFASNSAVSGPTSYEAYGGAVYNTGQMTSAGDTYTGNTVGITGSGASEAYGGAIFNYACCHATVALTAISDTFGSNRASAGGSAESTVLGGAIYSDAKLYVNGATFQSNSASGPYDVQGGAIYTDFSGSLIADSTFTSNAATGNVNVPNPYYAVGGAVDDEDGLTIDGTTFSSNAAVQAGGAFFDDDSGAVNLSTFKGNATTGAAASPLLFGCGGGGAIFGNANLTVTNSTLSGNTVQSQGTSSGGGGVYNDAGMTMTGTTVSGNAVVGTTGASGGGIFNNYTASITNSTIASNTSTGNGGGFTSYDVTGSYSVTFLNDTVYQNSATGSGGNVWDDYVLTFANTIVAGGTAASGPDIDNAATLTSGKYNIVGSSILGAFSPDATDQIGVDPQLLTLSANGGPTLTIADTATSPGTGHIPFTNKTCGPSGVGITTDQRGFARGAGGVCDVGAYEFAGVAGEAPLRVSNAHYGARKHAKHRGPLPAIRRASATPTSLDR